MTARKSPSSATETEVLTRSRRRCCICFGLARDVEVKKGQIAHLDHDSSNSSLDNLAFLCLEHHDLYDSSTSQSKNLTMAEVKKYRAELYDRVLPVIEASTARLPQVPAPPEASTSSFDAHKSGELKQILVEQLSDATGPIQTITGLARSSSVSRATAERLLWELAQEGTVRIDRARGSTKKVYSLATSDENRLIDTFIGALSEEVVSDERHFFKKQYALDAVVKTASGTIYVVDTVFAKNQLSRSELEKRIGQLAETAAIFELQNAVRVILVGITRDTRASSEALQELEDEGALIIKYIELE
jgi:hypothetical protein